MFMCTKFYDIINFVMLSLKSDFILIEHFMNHGLFLSVWTPKYDLHVFIYRLTSKKVMDRFQVYGHKNMIYLQNNFEKDLTGETLNKRSRILNICYIIFHIWKKELKLVLKIFKQTIINKKEEQCTYNDIITWKYK